MSATAPSQILKIAPHNTLSAPDRVAGLDGLRGLAILMVLVHHLTVFNLTSGLPARLGTLAEFCSHGVDLFFVLSGYLILDRLREESVRPGWLYRFCTKRAAKIAPTYFACLAGVYLVLPSLLKVAGATAKFATQSAAHGNWPWYATFCSNFLNAFDGRFTNPALDVCWSLGIEVQFYVLIAAYVFFAGVPHQRLLAAVVGIALASRLAAVKLGASWITILVLPWNRLDAFAAGAAVALGAWRWLGGRAGLAVAIGTALAPLILPWSRENAWVQTLGYTAVALSCGFLIYASISAPPTTWFSRILRSRLLRFLGTISYSIYLTHLPLRAVTRDLLLPRFIRPMVGPSVIIQQLVFTGITFCACVTTGWLVWRFFEEPMRRAWVRRAIPTPS